jgi:hypothetical protein
MTSLNRFLPLAALCPTLCFASLSDMIPQENPTQSLLLAFNLPDQEYVVTKGYGGSVFNWDMPVLDPQGRNRLLTLSFFPEVIVQGYDKDVTWHVGFKMKGAHVSARTGTALEGGQFLIEPRSWFYGSEDWDERTLPLYPQEELKKICIQLNGAQTLWKIRLNWDRMTNDNGPFKKINLE